MDVITMESPPSPSTTGLSVLASPEEPLLDIVFVHGFTGHPERTWAHKGEGQGQNAYEDDHGERPSKFRKLFNGKFARTSVYWPRDLVPATVKDTARVLTFGYDTNVRHKLGNPINQQTVYDIAYDFLISLESMRRLRPLRPLLFVAHSLGGIVVKETLRRSRGCEFTQSHLHNIYESTSGILFFGTPHSGADPRGPIQHIAEKVIKAAGFSVNKQIVDTLLPSSERLRELRDEFGPMAHQQGWIIYSFQEQYGVSALSGNKVVEDTASCLNDSTLEITQHIASNHMEMCRFIGPEDVEYKKVAGALERILEVASTKVGSFGRFGPLDVDQRRRYLDSLDFNQLDARHATIKIAHSRTCRWLLKTPQYQDWLDITKIPDHHGFLWIKGKPATGKSTIMKFTYGNAKKYIATADTIIISFFFNARGDDIEKSTIGMYRSLLFQLLEGIPDLQQVFELVRLRSPNSDGVYLWDIETVKDLFTRAIQFLGRRTLLCFIDALDECDDDQVLDMVESFEQIGEIAVSSQTRLHVCFSSRHYPHITIERGIQLVLEGEEGHQQDISNYLNSELKAGRSKLVEKIKEEIFERASGIFLWVVLVVKILNSEFRSGRIHALRKRLDEIPDGLDELFSDILTRDGHNMEELILCLQWILFARRPLKREELYYAVLSTPGGSIGAWEPDEIGVDDMERFILSSSKGLACVTKSKNKTVQFIHESVRDYLLKGKGFDTLHAGLDNLSGQSHNKLKECCQTYLAIDKSQYLPLAIQSLPLASTEEAASIRKLANERFPFLQYVTDNIFYHSDCAHGNDVNQLEFVKSFTTNEMNFSLQDWIYMRNLFEKFQVRRYTPGVSLLYILAEKDLPNLIRVELGRVPHMDPKGERHSFPLIAAIANNCESAIRAFLQAKNSPLVVEEYEEAIQCILRNQNQITSQKRTLLSWAIGASEYSLAKAIFLTEKVQVESSKAVLNDLFKASAKDGRADVVKQLLDQDIFGKDSMEVRAALCYASERGHEPVVKVMLNSGMVSVNAKNRAGRTPLWYACSNGNDGVGRLLVDTEEECDVNACEDGSTPLCQAIYNKDTKMANILLHTGRCDINSTNNLGKSPLLQATSNGDIAMARIILETGKCDMNKADNSGNTPLLEAASAGSIELVKMFLVTNRCDVDIKSHDGRSPLSEASFIGNVELVKMLQDRALLEATENGHMEVVKFLLGTRNCDINIRGNNGYTPLLSAISQGDTDIVRLLLGTGKCEINSTNDSGDTSLSIAASKGNMEISQLLLDMGAWEFINNKDKNGTTPLALAASCGHTDIVNALLKTGKCLVNLKDIHGDTALSLAASNGHASIITALLKIKKCDVDPKNNYGNTPLSRAVINGNVEEVKALLETGKCDVNSKNAHSRTPLSLAVVTGTIQAITALLKTVKSDVNSKDKMGNTPLSLAAMLKQDEAAKLLLETGQCKVNEKNHAGDTPLSLASSVQSRGIVELLLQTGEVDPTCINNQGQTPMDLASGDIKKLLFVAEMTTTNAS